MSYYGMGDHLRVGQQFQVPRSWGAQVIRRGPHGKPIAPPLAVDPAARGWGQELRWWSDYPTGSLSVPQQSVVGVSGFGLLEEPGVLLKRAIAARADELFTAAKACNYDCSAMLGAIKGFRVSIRQYPRWGAPTLPLYPSWQVIDITAQQAEVIALRRSRNQQIPAGALQRVKDDSTAMHVAPELAEATKDAALSVVNAPRDMLDAAEAAFQKNMKYQALLLGGAVLALGLVAFSYGAGSGVGARIAGGR